MGLCCRKYTDHAYFCIYEIKLPVTVVHVKVLKEGESQHGFLAFFFIDMSVLCPSSPLVNALLGT